MPGTIEVIPRRCWRHPSGRTASIYGAAPSPSEGYEVVTEGYTWRITDSTGSMRVGLGRRPATSRKEADATAAAFAERTGYRVIAEGAQ